MTGKETQSGFEDERTDDVAAVPHEKGGGDQDPKASPDKGRQDSETAPRT